MLYNSYILLYATSDETAAGVVAAFVIKGILVVTPKTTINDSNRLNHLFIITSPKLTNNSHTTLLYSENTHYINSTHQRFRTYEFYVVIIKQKYVIVNSANQF